MSHGSVSITPQMLFGASSITKTYVAALTLALAEEGQVTLQDSLHEWIDSLAHVDSSITTRQLLNHTSGAYDFVQFPDAWATILYDRSRVDVEETIVGEIAHPWIDTGGTSLMDLSSVPRTAAYAASWTSGAVFTTAEELAEWGQAWFGGEVLSEVSLRGMLTDPGNGSGLGTDLLLGEQSAGGESVVGMVGSGLEYSCVLA